MKISTTIAMTHVIQDIAPEVAKWSETTNKPITFQLESWRGNIIAVACRADVLLHPLEREIKTPDFVQAYDDLREAKQVRLFEYTGVWDWLTIVCVAEYEKHVLLAIFNTFVSGQQALYPNAKIIGIVTAELGPASKKAKIESKVLK